MCSIRRLSSFLGHFLVFREYVNNEASSNILPSYQKIVKFKKSRYPNDITVGETYAEVELQSLLDITASLSVEEELYIKTKIEKLMPTEFQFANKSYSSTIACNLLW